VIPCQDLSVPKNSKAAAPDRAKLLPPLGGACQCGPLPIEGAEVRLWSGQGGRIRLAVLIGILAIAAALHTIDIGQSPPGNLDDECMDIWNANCLLANGTDWHGVSWPIFYSRGIGDYRPMLFAYVLMPFQAVLGMSLWSGRFASGMLGVADILLAYVIGRKLLNNRTAGLLAAALLTLTPWHIRSCRTCFYAHPFFILLPLALVLMANLPLQNAQKRPPRPVLAGLAGAVGGICCYAYPAIRIFLPMFFLAAIAVSWRLWWELLRTRRGAMAIGLFVLGAAATLGPLSYKTLTDPTMNKRAETLYVWKPAADLGTNLKAVLGRYPAHYGLSFLFEQGDGQEWRFVRRIPGVGWFGWDAVPLLLAGLGLVLVKARRSYAARVVLAGLVLAPVPDLFFVADGPHAYRSLAVLPAVWLLATVGLAGAGYWIWARHRKFFLHAAAAMALASCVANVYSLRQFFGPYNTDSRWFLEHDADLAEACRWLKPKLDQADAVFIDAYSWHSIWLVSLVELGYDPKQWFRDPPDFQRNELGVGKPGQRDWDWCDRYGKVHFPTIANTGDAWRFVKDEWDKTLQQLTESGRKSTVCYIVRPGTLQLPVEPAYRIHLPDGRESLWVYWIPLSRGG
jgi:4-amino-4-deoxy-L-arabinose transferase-like glycosyltransferase